MKFKKGQKVIFVGKRLNPEMIYPSHREVVTLSYVAPSNRLRITDDRTWWVLAEYEHDISGIRKQCFPEDDFEPLKEDGAFAEETLKEVRIQQLEERIEQLEEKLKKQKQPL